MSMIVLLALDAVDTVLERHLAALMSDGMRRAEVEPRAGAGEFRPHYGQAERG
jgi:hypothetical protein